MLTNKTGRVVFVTHCVTQLCCTGAITDQLLVSSLLNGQIDSSEMSSDQNYHGQMSGATEDPNRQPQSSQSEIMRKIETTLIDENVKLIGPENEKQELYGRILRFVLCAKSQVCSIRVIYCISNLLGPQQGQHNPQRTSLKHCWVVPICQTTSDFLVAWFNSIGWMPFLVPTLDNADPSLVLVDSTRFLSAPCMLEVTNQDPPSGSL